MLKKIRAIQNTLAIFHAQAITKYIKKCYYNQISQKLLGQFL